MTGFMEKEFLNKETQTGETAYVVSMPYYEENTDSAEKREMMQDQAYYVKDTGLYYFRVTKEQYEQLTEAYFQAEAEAAVDPTNACRMHSGIYNSLVIPSSFHNLGISNKTNF